MKIDVHEHTHERTITRYPDNTLDLSESEEGDLDKAIRLLPDSLVTAYDEAVKAVQDAELDIVGYLRLTKQKGLPV